MKLITTKDQIRTVAERWFKRYESDILQGDSLRTSVYKFLQRLDPETTTTQQVHAIIGNDSWTKLACDECNCEVYTVVRTGSADIC